MTRVVGLLKIRNILSEAGGVRRLALLVMLDRLNAGRFHLVSGYILMGKRTSGRDMRIVDIGTVIEQAHVIPSGERQ